MYIVFPQSTWALPRTTPASSLHCALPPEQLPWVDGCLFTTNVSPISTHRCCTFENPSRFVEERRGCVLSDPRQPSRECPDAWSFLRLPRGFSFLIPDWQSERRVAGPASFIIPSAVLRGLAHGHQLCLRGGCHDQRLFAASPIDQVRSQHAHVPSEGLPIVVLPEVGVVKIYNSTLMQMVHSANTDRVDDGSFNNIHYRSITE